MKRFLKIVLSKIGIDKAIAYSSSSRIISGIAGVLSIFFISIFLTGVEQGFYFTFGSILALQVFFELGLTGIMTQFVLYEASHLELDDNLHYIQVPIQTVFISPFLCKMVHLYCSCGICRFASNWFYLFQSFWKR